MAHAVLFLLALMAISFPVGTSVVKAQGNDQSEELVLKIKYAERAPSYLKAVPTVGSYYRFFVAQGDGESKTKIAVEVRPRLVGESIEVELIVTPNLPPWLNFSDDVLKEFEQSHVGAYRLGLNQSMVLRDLEPFQLGPLELAVVTEQPDTPNPLNYVDDSDALEVIEIRESRDSYQVVVKNVSGRDIHTVQLFTPVGPNNGSSQIQSALFDPLIEADGRHEFRVSKHHGHDPPTIVIKTIVFQDGTFEGDPRIAARYIAMKEGISIQITRALPFLREARLMAEHDSIGAKKRLSILLGAMIDQPDHYILRGLQRHFPNGRSKDVRAALREGLKEGFERGKRMLLESIPNVDLQSSGNTTHVSLGDLLDAHIRRYGGVYR